MATAPETGTPAAQQEPPPPPPPPVRPPPASSASVSPRRRRQKGDVEIEIDRSDVVVDRAAASSSALTGDQVIALMHYRRSQAVEFARLPVAYVESKTDGTFHTARQGADVVAVASGDRHRPEAPAVEPTREDVLRDLCQQASRFALGVQAGVAVLVLAEQARATSTGQLLAWASPVADIVHVAFALCTTIALACQAHVAIDSRRRRRKVAVEVRAILYALSLLVAFAANLVGARAGQTVVAGYRSDPNWWLDGGHQAGFDSSTWTTLNYVRGACALAAWWVFRAPPTDQDPAPPSPWAEPA